jgi:3-hydroxybutyrate dehydrogenase
MNPSTAASGERPLENRHALVTGGGKGIGAAVAAALAGAGAKLTLVGRHRETLEETAAGLRQATGAPVAVETADVTDEASIARAVEAARQAQGPIHILVNNAGQAASQLLVKTDLELWNRLLAVNLTGTFLATRAALPDMVAAGWGRVVNVASIAGLVGAPYITAYCASKHGVVGLTRALAAEVATKGITVNAVCPGYTETDMVLQAVSTIMAKTGRSEADARADLAKGNPQGRILTVEEVAGAVLYCCLPSSAGFNGQTLALNGGQVG